MASVVRFFFFQPSHFQIQRFASLITGYIFVIRTLNHLITCSYITKLVLLLLLLSDQPCVKHKKAASGKKNGSSCYSKQYYLDYNSEKSK